MDLVLHQSVNKLVKLNLLVYYVMQNKTVSVFETTIRVLGGLLSAHLIASDYATVLLLWNILFFSFFFFLQIFFLAVYEIKSWWCMDRKTFGLLICINFSLLSIINASTIFHDAWLTLRGRID